MAYSSFSQGYNNPMSDLGKGFANAQLGASGTFNKFRNNKVVSGTTDFFRLVRFLEQYKSLLM